MTSRLREGGDEHGRVDAMTAGTARGAACPGPHAGWKVRTARGETMAGARPGADHLRKRVATPRRRAAPRARAHTRRLLTVGPQTVADAHGHALWEWRRSPCSRLRAAVRPSRIGSGLGGPRCATTRRPRLRPALTFLAVSACPVPGAGRAPGRFRTAGPHRLGPPMGSRSPGSRATALCSLCAGGDVRTTRLDEFPARLSTSASSPRRFRCSLDWVSRVGQETGLWFAREHRPSF